MTALVSALQRARKSWNRLHHAPLQIVDVVRVLVRVAVAALAAPLFVLGEPVGQRVGLALGVADKLVRQQLGSRRALRSAVRGQDA